LKLLSLWEPWATLMAIGAKRIETRSWSTSYRGWLAIQASKGGLSREEFFSTISATPGMFLTLVGLPGFCELFNRRQQLRLNGMPIEEVFPLGKIVAVVRLIDVLPVDVAGTCLSGLFDEYSGMDTPLERAFGNYDDLDRYGWVTDKLFRLPEPIPFKAKQGLCDVPDEIVREIQRQGWNAPDLSIGPTDPSPVVQPPDARSTESGVS
jgi:activating signal cointegrator 1